MFKKKICLITPDNSLNQCHFLVSVRKCNKSHPFLHILPHPILTLQFFTMELQIELALCENLGWQKNSISKCLFSMIHFEGTERFHRAGFILRHIFIQEISPLLVLHPLLLPFHTRTEQATSHTSLQGPVFSTASALLPNSALCRWCMCILTHQNRFY